MNKLKVEAAGQCRLNCPAFTCFVKAHQLIPGFLFFIKWKFIQILQEVLYDNRKLC